MDNNPSSDNPEGRIMVSLNDGRYLRTLIKEIDRPTSLALNPEKGYVYKTKLFKQRNEQFA
jgi:hypothetical protein